MSDTKKTVLAVELHASATVIVVSAQAIDMSFVTEAGDEHRTFLQDVVKLGVDIRPDGELWIAVWLEGEAEDGSPGVARLSLRYRGPYTIWYEGAS